MFKSSYKRREKNKDKSVKFFRHQIDRAKVILRWASKFYFCHTCRGAIENLMGVRVLSDFKNREGLRTVVYFYMALNLFKKKIILVFSGHYAY